MKFGYHVSIARGLTGGIDQALRTGCECAQIFTRSPRTWAARSLDEKGVEAFRRAWADTGLAPLAVHLPYLPNPAALEPDLLEKSLRVLVEELDRSVLLGASCLVVHPGHVRKSGSRDEALEQVVKTLLAAFDRSSDPLGVTLALETMSGQRGELGDRFEELALLIREVERGRPDSIRLGVCLDTAHIWGAGYDLTGPAAQSAMIEEFDRVVGLERLELIHLNDSLSEPGGRLDRHAAVGRGRIGARSMARLVRQKAFSGIGAIMETPFVSEAEDREHMARAKRWRARR